MKISCSIKFLAVAALVFLLLPQSAAAADKGEKGLPDPDLMFCNAPREPLVEQPLEKSVGGPCSWCTANSSCSYECDDNGNPSTCGDYGVCDFCREALVEIGRNHIGRKAKTVFWGVCEFKWYYWVTYRSQNSSSCPTYTYCEVDTETHTYNPAGLYCCDKIPGGCFGVRC